MLIVNIEKNRKPKDAPFGFVFLDRDLRFVRINERLAEMNGCSVAAHLGKTARAPGITRHWNESCCPVQGEHGEIIGFGAVVEEITARKQAEAALRLTNDRFELAVRASKAVLPGCRWPTHGRSYWMPRRRSQRVARP